MGEVAAIRKKQKYGARVVMHKDGAIQVMQTVKKGPRHDDPYVIDEHREKFVNASENDAAVGRAVRDAPKRKAIVAHLRIAAGEKSEANART